MMDGTLFVFRHIGHDDVERERTWPLMEISQDDFGTDLDANATDTSDGSACMMAGNHQVWGAGDNTAYLHCRG